MFEWVNTPTDEKFTALHFATYHGNFDLITIMVDEMGANIHAKNVYGANVLHIAAQGDQPCPLYYFAKIKNMNINDVDNRGSTPLHWACYSKSEYALSYILAMAPNLEAKDQNGLTPLHLAIKSVGELKSTRPVRSLLLKGSNRRAKSNAEHTSTDMIKDNVEPHLKTELENMLQEPVYIECCLPKIPLVPIRQNHKT